MRMQPSGRSEQFRLPNGSPHAENQLKRKHFTHFSLNNRTKDGKLLILQQ